MVLTLEICNRSLFLLLQLLKRCAKLRKTVSTAKSARKRPNGGLTRSKDPSPLFLLHYSTCNPILCYTILTASSNPILLLSSIFGELFARFDTNGLISSFCPNWIIYSPYLDQSSFVSLAQPSSVRNNWLICFYFS